LELGRADEAVAAFDHVLAADPRNVTALINRGNALIKDKRYDDALGSYDNALSIDPAHAAALTDRGVALAELDRLEEALAAHEQALRVNPHVVAAHVNRGNAMLKLARMEEALANYAEALAHEPDNAEANFNASLARLCLGDFAGGWPQYEYRWKKKDFMSTVPDYPQPLWRGDADLAGKTIFLLAEQGLGDTLQFVRYAPLVAERGAKVILGVQKPLRLLATTVPGVALVRTDGEPLPDFDTYCPLLSLPLAFGTELATIPANIPYLRPHAERLAQWRPRLPDNGRLRVGICWAGSKDHLNDRNRSMPLDRFATLLSVPNLDFICIQKEVGAADAAALDQHGVLQLGREFDDFADTAAVVATLDLLVSVDTSVAHLAGAMGKPVALLVPFSPDFRWLLYRTESPWYPSMRLFRQTAIGDWSGPLEKLRAELEAVAQRTGRA
jgi:tetratricopeptide (TPR) repeat protein